MPQIITSSSTDSTDLIKDKPFYYKELTYSIIGALIEVHKTLGPGFLESAYHEAVIKELQKRGLKVETEKQIVLQYKGEVIKKQRIDLVVENKVLVEIKTVSKLVRMHIKTVLAYLKASGLKIGILANFAKNRLEYRRLIV